MIRSPAASSTVTVDDDDALLLYTAGVLPGAAGEHAAGRSRPFVRALRSLPTGNATPALRALLDAVAPGGRGCALLARARPGRHRDEPGGASLLVSRDCDRDSLDRTRADVP